ncbi:MAG: pyridoxamine 5'-phosphate oxidase family protein [Rhodospirillales bacterium]|nr:pyridoxamine 5'-phosphate oxidase family protein [Rhodospirillales bacterium]
MAANQEPSALATAAALLRGAHSAVLATTQGSQPYASLVTPALDDAARPILLLSNLAAHTKHLRVNPRCALFIQGTPPTSNPQTAPRLCLMGEAMTVEAELVRAIYLRAHPYAAAYAGFTDFSFWKLEISETKFIGGFAQAHDLNFSALQQEVLKNGPLGDG